MDLSGFDAPGFTGTNATATKAAPAKVAKAPGLASRLISGLTQAPKYFLNQDIVNPAKDIAATVSGNKVAEANVQKARQNLNGNNVGEALKRLAGNTAQLATTVAGPEAAEGAGLLGKSVAAAKGGAIIGAGSAAANDQNIVKGAAEGAALGGVTPAAAKLVGKVLPGSVSNDLAASTGEDPSLLNKAKANANNHLQQMEATSGGFNAGAKLPGSGPEGISLEESQKLSQLGQKYKIPAGAPTTRLRAIQGQLNTAGSEIDQKLAANNTPLSSEDKQAIMQEFQSKVDQIPPTANKGDIQTIATNLKQHFMGGGAVTDDYGHTLTPEEQQAQGITGGSSVKDLVSMNDYRRNLDKEINFNRSASTPDPASEQVATAMRNTLSDQLGKHAPDVAGANKTYSELKALEAPTLSEANRMSQTQGGVTNRLLNNPISRGLENKVATQGQKLTGGVASNAGESLPVAGQAAEATPAAPDTAATPPTAPAASNPAQAAVANPLVQNAATLGAVGASQQPGGSPTPAPAGTASQLLGGASGAPSDTSGGDVLGFGGTPSSDASSGQPQMTEQDLVALVAADPAHASDYQALYKTLNPSTASTSLDATQQKEITAGEAAINGMQQYAQQIDQLAGGSTGNVATGKVSTLLGKYDPFASSSQKQAAALQSNQREVAIQIATSLSGGTKPSAASVAEIENSLPSVNDSPQERQDKVNDFVSRMETNMRTYATPVSSITAGL